MRIRVNIHEVVKNINEDFGSMLHETDKGVRRKNCLVCNWHIQCGQTEWITRKMILHRHDKLLPIVPIAHALKESCTYMAQGIN